MTREFALDRYSDPFFFENSLIRFVTILVKTYLDQENLSDYFTGCVHFLFRYMYLSGIDIILHNLDFLQGVLDGNYDALSEQSFYMVGGIEEVIAKADKIAKESAA